MDKENGYGWIITKDHIADQDEPEGTNSNAVGVMGPSDCPFTAEEIRKRGDYFIMYDDDVERYYDGYMLATGEEAGTEDAMFSPLDNFGMPNAGATAIKYRNKETGKMEVI